MEKGNTNNWSISGAWNAAKGYVPQSIRDNTRWAVQGTIDMLTGSANAVGTKISGDTENAESGWVVTGPNDSTATEPRGEKSQQTSENSTNTTLTERKIDTRTDDKILEDAEKKKPFIVNGNLNIKEKEDFLNIVNGTVEELKKVKYLDLFSYNCEFETTNERETFNGDLASAINLLPNVYTISFNKIHLSALRIKELEEKIDKININNLTLNNAEKEIRFDSYQKLKYLDINLINGENPAKFEEPNESNIQFFVKKDVTARLPEGLQLIKVDEKPAEADDETTTVESSQEDEKKTQEENSNE